MNKLIKQEIDRLSPWHYAHVIKGIPTGDARVEETHPKLVELINSGCFTRSVYPKVLDLGANSGIISQWFVDNKGSKVDAIEHGTKYYPQLEFVVEHKGYIDKIIPINKNIIDGNFGYMEFDLVLFLGTLHHISSDYHLDILKSCYESLVPGGETVVQTRSDSPVGKLLQDSKFINIELVQGTSWHDRAAWKAIRDPMKVV